MNFLRLIHPEVPGGGPGIRYRNQRAAARVGLDTLTDAEWIAHFGRFEPLPGGPRAAAGAALSRPPVPVYNPEIGDGRGFLFAQLHDAETGGCSISPPRAAGRTPWSRTGDGRLTLKGGVREVLATRCSRRSASTPRRAFALSRPASS